jgi:SAM-dependent methyltransferase
VDDLVVPIRAEAHGLPFAAGFFDVVVSVDAYHYFGTDDLYLSYLLTLLVRGGRIGVVVPGIREETDDLPRPLSDHWDPEYWSFHSPAWWRRQWERTDAVDVDLADFLPDGRDLWMRWGQVLRDANITVEDGVPRPTEEVDDLALLESDTTGLLGFTRVVGRRRRRPIVAHSSAADRA